MTENSTLEQKKATFSKKQIQKAGEYLINSELDTDPNEYNQSMEILSYWRAAHAPALESTTNMLTRECKKHDTEALIAKRLKRTPSIIKKLRRFNEMKLRNMQDIGGCRAVLKNIKTLNRVYREINKGGEYKNKNYIQSPKLDGYRGIHITYPVATAETQFRIEIQLRTKVQHAWSTAVEIVDLFTNQNLKSNKGKDEWKEFFKAASIEIEKIENGQELKACDNLRTFITLLREMKVQSKFEQFSSLVDKIESPDHSQSGEYNLLYLTKDQNKIVIKNFKSSQFREASSEYLKLEKTTRRNTKNVVALISVTSLHNLKEAYPNYFADSKHFLSLIKEIEHYGEIYYPKGFIYKLLSMAGFGEIDKTKALENLARGRQKS